MGPGLQVHQHHGQSCPGNSLSSEVSDHAKQAHGHDEAACSLPRHVYDLVYSENALGPCMTFYLCAQGRIAVTAWIGTLKGLGALQQHATQGTCAQPAALAKVRCLNMSCQMGLAQDAAKSQQTSSESLHARSPDRAQTSPPHPEIPSHP